MTHTHTIRLSVIDYNAAGLFDDIRHQSVFLGSAGISQSITAWVCAWQGRFSSASIAVPCPPALPSSVLHLNYTTYMLYHMQCKLRARFTPIYKSSQRRMSDIMDSEWKQWFTSLHFWHAVSLAAGVTVRWVNLVLGPSLSGSLCFQENHSD